MDRSTWNGKLLYAASHDFSWTKKNILLVDVHPRTRDSRAKTMRGLGVVVDPVSSAALGLSHFVSTRYNMVLIDLGRDQLGAQHLAAEISTRKPRQLIAFLVGHPLYVLRYLSDLGRPAQAETISAEPVTEVDDRHQ